MSTLTKKVAPAIVLGAFACVLLTPTASAAGVAPAPTGSKTNTFRIDSRSKVEYVETTPGIVYLLRTVLVSRSGTYAATYNGVRAGCKSSGVLSAAANAALWSDVSAMTTSNARATATPGPIQTAQPRLISPDYGKPTEFLNILNPRGSSTVLHIQSAEATSIMQRLRALLPPCAA